MKKQIIFLLTTILSFTCYAQISFEKGYFIDNSNQNVDCLIRNADWEDNPSEFEYKLTENSEKEKGTLQSVKEFGIYNISKYLRNTVKIDWSSDEINRLSTIRKPTVFSEEELFLKVLVEGKANLYLAKKGNLKRYLYNKDSSDIEQLIFKKYLTPENKLAKDNRYKQQLLNDLKCSAITANKVDKLVYKKNELVKFFTDYNQCTNEEFITYEKNQKKDLFNLNIRPGINSSSLSIQNNISNINDADFDKEMTFRFGIEAEFILPFKKNKWAVLVEPTYQYYKSETEVKTGNAKVDYTSIELSAGVRHYFFLNENSKIFVNALVIFDLNSNSVIEFDPGTNLEIFTNHNYSLGVGYKQNDRFSLELRYLTVRDVLYSASYWNSDYNTVSLIFGYSLF